MLRLSNAVLRAIALILRTYGSRVHHQHLTQARFDWYGIVPTLRQEEGSGEGGERERGMNIGRD